MLPAMDAIIESMTKLSLEFSDAAMLARTHGQTASPTTMGKEFANVAYRLARQRKQVRTVCRCSGRPSSGGQLAQPGRLFKAVHLCALEKRHTAVSQRKEVDEFR